MKTLYLIDGYAQFYRAFHAIRTPMTSPVTKEPTNMTFGFVGMLLRLLRGEPGIAEPPDYLAVALDVSGDRGTFRSEIYPDYKATRPPIPEGLPEQVDRCLDILKAIEVPQIGSAGFEADDVLATIVKATKDVPDLQLRIVSKDKDLKQLLEPGRVEMYDVHTAQLYDADALEEETGLRPEQVIDMLALMGDNVDNIPGVEGVGPKTAAQLIAAHGSLDQLIKNADTVKGKRGERLREAVDRLPTNVSLVTLERNTPIDFDLEQCRVKKDRLETLYPILRELGFNRYQDELDELLEKGDKPQPKADGFGDTLFDFGGADDGPAASASDYTSITDLDKLDSFLKSIDPKSVIAIETVTQHPQIGRGDLCGIAITAEVGSARYIPLRAPRDVTLPDSAQIVDRLRGLLENPKQAKAGSNLKLDALALRREGISLRGITAGETDELPFDCMVASYLIDASRSSHAIDALALALLDVTLMTDKELLGTASKRKTTDQTDIHRVAEYACARADAALRLRDGMLQQLHAMDLTSLYRDLELPLVEVLAEMEANGITVDRDELARQRERLQQRLKELRDDIDEHSMNAIGRTFNPESPKQLSGVLFGKPDDPEPGLAIKPIKRTKTGYSTDIEVLEKLAADPDVDSPLPELVVEHRKLTKLIGTYLTSLDDDIQTDGRIHASFNQAVAATGRLSSSDPNLQNIPIRTDLGREIRRAFVAPRGHLLISADYSQIELRLLAHLANDPALKEAFEEGQDIHTAVAAQIHNIDPIDVTPAQRSGAKMVNFGIVYGITPFGLARRLAIPTGEAADIINDYKRRFAGISTFLHECVAQAASDGYVETIMKRRRPIPEITARNPVRRSLAERMAINSVVQGSAADLIKLAMIELHKRLAPTGAHLRDNRSPDVDDVRMILQIHDELVFEAREDVAEDARACITSVMENAMRLDVNLVVDSAIAPNWYEGK